jgi:hypothetical protein
MLGAVVVALLASTNFSAETFAGALVPVKAGLPARSCENSLVVHSIPDRVVTHLGQNAQPHNSALQDDSDVVALSERRLYVDAPWSPLKVTQVDVNDMVIVNNATGERLADDAILRFAANQYLATVSGGSVRLMDLHGAKLVKSHASVAFALSTTLGENFVLLYNYLTKKITSLVRENNGGLNRSVRIEHERFVISEIQRPSVNQSSFSIYDLKEGSQIDLKAANLTSVFISEDGRTLLQSTETGERRVRVFKNILVRITRKTLPTELELTRLRKTLKFEGAVIATSADLNRLVIDKNNLRANYPKMEHAYPWLAPDLAVLEIKKDQVKMKGLKGWKPVLSKIKEAAGQGTAVTVNGLSAELTPDGKTLSVKLEFKTVLGVHPDPKFPTFTKLYNYEQNLVGLWDLDGAKDPLITTSAFLDTKTDVEPHPGLLSSGIYTGIWGRKFATHLLPSGVMVVARAETMKVDDTLSDVVVKIATLRPGQMPDSVLEYRTGPVNLSPNGDGRWVGITRLQVGSSGRKVILDITGVGTKIIDLSSSNLKVAPELPHRQLF